MLLAPPLYWLPFQWVAKYDGRTPGMLVHALWSYECCYCRHGPTQVSIRAICSASPLQGCQANLTVSGYIVRIPHFPEGGKGWCDSYGSHKGYTILRSLLTQNLGLDLSAMFLDSQKAE